ncbi:MAG: hypothetical protein AAB469_01720 [Patescibacteria group bacterium]
MQADTLKIDNLDTLFTMVTTLEPPARRMAVFQAIANPKIVIGHQWSDCLFAVMARAADQTLIGKTINRDIAAKALGIPDQWVKDGVSVWDKYSGHADERRLAKESFRNKIRQHLREVEATAPIRTLIS